MSIGNQAVHTVPPPGNMKELLERKVALKEFKKPRTLDEWDKMQHELARNRALLTGIDMLMQLYCVTDTNTDEEVNDKFWIALASLFNKR